MSINESIQCAENVLLESLLEQQEGVDDRTGKGKSAEMLIEERLIRPASACTVPVPKGLRYRGRKAEPDAHFDPEKIRSQSTPWVSYRPPSARRQCRFSFSQSACVVWHQPRRTPAPSAYVRAKPLLSGPRK
jgi:hypothetical protein